MNNIPILTVRDYQKKMLIQRGFSEPQAEEVMLHAIAEINGKDKMDVRFESKSDGYEPGLHAALFKLIRPIALKWLNENKPDAWFKPIFEN